MNPNALVWAADAVVSWAISASTPTKFQEQSNKIWVLLHCLRESGQIIVLSPVTQLQIMSWLQHTKSVDRVILVKRSQSHVTASRHAAIVGKMTFIASTGNAFSAENSSSDVQVHQFAVIVGICHLIASISDYNNSGLFTVSVVIGYDYRELCGF